ncbi:MAG: HEPN domain-containing protein [Clostridia bacterium]|nr:HEPN domain-containing protein [Clostridia bacterium]
MSNEVQKELSQTRMLHARECLAAAQSLLASENLKSAANRAYYAIFHAMRAVLAFDGIDMKHHSGIISSFRRLYIKTEVFSADLSVIISELYDLRTGSDYDDFFIVTGDEMEEQVKNAAYFLSEIQKYLDNQ